MAALADGFARVAGRVAIVGEDAEGIVEARGEVVKLGELILSERFGGEEIERAGVGIFEDGIEDGQVVAERFAGGGGRDDYQIFAFASDGLRRRLDANRAFRCLSRDRLRLARVAPRRASGGIGLRGRECALRR